MGNRGKQEKTNFKYDKKGLKYEQSEGHIE